jgi:hypothetical protein
VSNNDTRIIEPLYPTLGINGSLLNNSYISTPLGSGSDSSAGPDGNPGTEDEDR